MACGLGRGFGARRCGSGASGESMSVRAGQGRRRCLAWLLRCLKLSCRAWNSPHPASRSAAAGVRWRGAEAERRSGLPSVAEVEESSARGVGGPRGVERRLYASPSRYCAAAAERRGGTRLTRGLKVQCSWPLGSGGGLLRSACDTPPPLLVASGLPAAVASRSRCSRSSRGDGWR